METVSQGIEVLTGVPAGVRGADDEFPDGTVFARVEARLREYALTRKQFGNSQTPATAQGDDG